MSRSYSAALPVARVVLQILIVLNWLVGAVTIVLLVAMPIRQWIMSALELAPGREADRVIMALVMIAILGLVMVPLNHVVLQRLSAIVRSVGAGDPFVASNARRLQAIAWALLGVQVLGIVIGLIAKSGSSPAHPLHIGAGFSTGGALAVLLTFVLARVFAEGTRMRDDLEGTV